jgi:hypothetical protein
MRIKLSPQTEGREIKNELFFFALHATFNKNTSKNFPPNIFWNTILQYRSDIASF